MLAFGDSLVDGWTSFSSGSRERFSAHLERTLSEEHAIPAEVTAIGRAGLPAAGAAGALSDALSSRRFDVVLILLGANDFYPQFAHGTCPSPEVIDKAIADLHTLHSSVRRSGAVSVALGVLHHPAFEIEGGHAAIESFNSRLASESGADTFIDAASFVPADVTSLWSSDRVHLQPGMCRRIRTCNPQIARAQAPMISSDSMASRDCPRSKIPHPGSRFHMDRIPNADRWLRDAGSQAREAARAALTAWRWRLCSSSQAIAQLAIEGNRERSESGASAAAMRQRHPTLVA